MNRPKLLTIASLAAIIAVLTSTLAVSYALQIQQGRFIGSNKLTKEQKAQIVQMIITMKRNGATAHEIKAAVASMFNGWGIQTPQNGGLWFRILIARIRQWIQRH